jgi:galactose mutarotase-like enzyme
MDNPNISSPKIKLTFAPERGGIITGIYVNHGGKERQIVQSPGDPPDPNARGMFPMAPTVGRVSNRCFDATRIREVGRRIELCHPADPDRGLHGIVRQRPFRIVNAYPDRLELLYVHESDFEGGYGWFGPFEYSLVYKVIDDTTFETKHRLQNTGQASWPTVIGEHPKFIRDQGIRFRFSAERILRIDPTELVPLGEPMVIPKELDFSRGKEAPGDLEVLYTGWGGFAEMSYPDMRIMIMGHNQPGGKKPCLMAWHLASQQYCALEHQTGEADAVNRMNSGKWSGGRILNPGQVIELTTTYRISPNW